MRGVLTNEIPYSRYNGAGPLQYAEYVPPRSPFPLFNWKRVAVNVITLCGPHLKYLEGIKENDTLKLFESLKCTVLMSGD